jgi:BlaI family penicillinase repressor
MKLSDAEWTVMNAVWQQAPATPRDVLERTEPATGWAYTTVKTLMERLVEKGALKSKKRANTRVYEPRVSRSEARLSALHDLVDRAFGGTFGSLVHFMVEEERLTEADRAELEQMIETAITSDRGRSK